MFFNVYKKLCLWYRILLNFCGNFHKNFQLSHHSKLNYFPSEIPKLITWQETANTAAIFLSTWNRPNPYYKPLDYSSKGLQMTHRQKSMDSEYKILYSFDYIIYSIETVLFILFIYVFFEINQIFSLNIMYRIIFT